MSLSDDESFIIDPCQDYPSPPQVPEEEKEQLNALIDDMVQEIKVASFMRNDKPASGRAPGSAASATTCWSTSCTRNILMTDADLSILQKVVTGRSQFTGTPTDSLPQESLLQDLQHR